MASSPPLPTASDVRAAAERLRGRVVRTPTLRLRALERAGGPEIWAKCENLQHVRAFKARGALHAAARLDPAARARGLVTYSSGNHAQAVALAALGGCPRTTLGQPPSAPPRAQNCGRYEMCAFPQWTSCRYVPRMVSRRHADETLSLSLSLLTAFPTTGCDTPSSQPPTEDVDGGAEQPYDGDGPVCGPQFVFADILSDTSFEDDCLIVTMEGVDFDGEVTARIQVHVFEDGGTLVAASFEDGFGTVEADSDENLTYWGSLERPAFEARVFAAQEAFIKRIATAPVPPQEGWLACGATMLAAAATCTGASLCTAATSGLCGAPAWSACAAGGIGMLCACCKGSNSLICGKLKDAC